MRVIGQLAVLAVAAYVYVVAEMAPVGAMPAIAADLHVDEADVGLLTAAYALISIVVTVPLVRWTARWPKRRILVLTLFCLTLAQALSAVAPGLGWLAGSRVLCAVTHGLMWSIIVPIGARLVPSTHTGRATTAIYVGSAAALVIGNPLTNAMSQAWGWRPTVALMAVAAGVVTLVAAAILPAMPATSADAATPVAATGMPLYRNRRLMTLCGLTLIGVTAHFASYTFIVPIIRDVVGVHGGDQAWVLVGYGVAGLATLAGLARALDSRLRATAVSSLAVLCLALSLLTAIALTGGSGGTLLGVGAIAAWGASAAVLPPVLQSAAIRVAPEAADQASALYVTAFQAGILSGSVAGGLLYAHIGFVAVLGTAAVLFVVTGIGVLARGDAFLSVPN